MMFLDADFERRFDAGPTIQVALKRPVASYSVTALVGPSGCGKTTVLRCLAGLDVPRSGRISCGDDVWFDGSGRIFQRPQERGIGYLCQEYALFPHLTVEGNIAFGLAQIEKGAARKRIADLVSALQLTGLESRYPHELSGGQQQRVALARTVAPRPRLLLLDEPLSALDTPTRSELRQELRRVLAEWGIPTIVVTHDPAEVVALADEVIVLLEGRVRQYGTVEQVFSHPFDADVARIVNCR